MTVSVIVALYNVEEYAEECVKSIVKQTYKDLDIILVDDGSTDGTGSILDEWRAKDSRITVVHGPNEGLSCARNKGMRLAKGDVYAFIDGDDAVKENYFEILVNNMEATGADMSMAGRYENILGEDTIKYVSPVDELTIYDDYRQFIYDTYTDKDKRFFVCAIVSWGKIYKKELWHDLEFPAGRINEDSWVFPELISRCRRIVVSPEPVYFYRKRPGSIMSVVNERLIRSKTESWMNQVRWWRESGDSDAERLLSACEKYICHYIYTVSKGYSSDYRKIIGPEYKKMVNHMTSSKYIPLITRMKYVTYARPGAVFK